MKIMMISEWKRNLKSLALWTAIVSGLVILMLMLYPAFKDAFSEIENFLAVYPEAF
jgi:ABC-2 type transport system permease protein